MSIRTGAQRKADALDLLAREEDAWVASADDAGRAYLIPLSYHWDGTRLVFATLEQSTTTRNLRRAGRMRAALQYTRDVVIVEGPAAIVSGDGDPALADAFAARLTWDPRKEPDPYVYITLTPDFVQAWRDVPELTGRTIMRNGVWLDGETERRTDGETERRRDGQTERRRDGETGRRTDGEAERRTDGIEMTESSALEARSSKLATS